MKNAKRRESTFSLVIDRFRLMMFSLSPKSKFFRNVAVLTSGSALAQAITIIAAPILSRLYQPGDYGVLAVYISILGLINVAVALRYEGAIPLPDSKVTAANLLALSLLIVLVMSVLFGFFLWGLGDYVVAWTRTPSIGPFLWLLPIGLLGGGMYQAMNAWAIRNKEFSRLSRTRVSQSLGMSVTQLGLGVLNFGSLGLLFGDIVGRAGGIGTLATLTLRNDRDVLKQITLSGIRSAAVRYKKFPLISSWSSVLNSASLQLPSLLLAATYGPKVVGLMAMSQRIIGAPLTFIGLSIGQVYFSEASRLATDNPKGLLSLFLVTARRLFFIGIIPISALAVGGSWLFSLLFGDAWRGSGQYTQLLAFMFIAQFITTPLSSTLDVLERFDWHLLWDVVRLVLVVAGLILTAELGWSANTAIAVYGVIMLLAYIALFLISYHAIEERIKDNPSQEQIIMEAS